jgi:hypothetical protein
MNRDRQIAYILAEITLNKRILREKAGKHHQEKEKGQKPTLKFRETLQKHATGRMYILEYHERALAKNKYTILEINDRKKFSALNVTQLNALISRGPTEVSMSPKSSNLI